MKNLGIENKEFEVVEPDKLPTCGKIIDYRFTFLSIADINIF